MDTLNDCVRKLNYISLNSIVFFCFSNSVYYLRIRDDIEKQRNSIFPWELETLMSLAVLAYPQLKEEPLSNNTAHNLIKVIRNSNLSIKHGDNIHLGKNLLSNIGLQQFEYQLFFKYQYYLYSYIFKDETFSRAIIKRYGTTYEYMSAVVMTLYLSFFAIELNSVNRQMIKKLINKNLSTVKALTITVEEYKDVLKSWNFKLDDYRYLLCPLYEKPFLSFNNELTVPLPHVLTRSITTSMLYCVTRDNNTLRNRLGKILEDFAFTLIRNNCHCQEIYQEKQFTTKCGDIKTRDVNCLFNNGFLLIECKSYVPSIKLRNFKEENYLSEVDRLAKEMKKIYKDICINRIKYSDYNQFKAVDICKANKDDIYCFLVLLEDSYISRKDVYDKCANNLGINEDSQEYQWLISHISIISYYTLIELAFKCDDIISYIKSSEPFNFYNPIEAKKEIMHGEDYNNAMHDLDVRINKMVFSLFSQPSDHMP